MPEGMRLRTASERRAPARFGDPDEGGEVNYIDHQVPQLDNLNSNFPHPVYQFDNQLARECAFPSLPFNHPGPGPSGAILNEKRKNGEIATLPPDQAAVVDSTGDDQYQGDEVNENEAESEHREEPTRKVTLKPITRDQTTISGKPNPAIRNHGDRGRPDYNASAEDWIAAANQRESRNAPDFETFMSMADQVDPGLPSFGPDPWDRALDNDEDWRRTSSEYHLDVSPSPPGTPSTQSHEDPFVTHPEVPNIVAPEVGVSQPEPQPRRPYTVHIDRDAAKKKADERERNKNRNFELRSLSQKTPDWSGLSDGMKYILVYEMTKTGMSFVQVIRTFRLGASEAGELMNLVGAEQRKIDSFDEEVKKHLHTADLTWMDEYNKTHTPLITDHLTAKEIRQAKAFMNFMGFKDIASKLGEYVGVGTGRRFPIVLNHFWGDGFKDLPPHFKVFCSEELGEMASTWNDLQRKHPPRLSTPEMHVRLDPPPGTINPRRLLNDPEPFSSARYPLGGHNLAHRAHINEPLIQDPSLQVASSTPSFPPSLYGSRSHGVPTVNAGYHHSGRTQPVGRPQHGLPVFLPDPGYGVPINPFATLPPPSMPHNPGHAQYGSWQPYFQVQYEPQFPEGPQHQQMYQDRGSYWGPPSYYREPENIHFTMAMGEDQSPRPAPLIIRRPYSPLPARHQQPSDIDVIESEQDWEFNLSPAFGHGFRRAPGSNNMEAPHIADLQPHRRPPGPMGHHPQQVADRGLGDLIDLTSDPRRSMGTARGAVQQGTNPSRMGYVPRGQFSNTTGALGMTPAGELSRQNIASSSRSEVPLLNTAQLAMLYNTYDQPRPSTGTLDHAVDNVRTSDAQQAKHIPSEPLLNYPRHEIQQRDPRLQKQVDQWRNKFQNTWTPEPESGSEFDSQDHEEEAVPSVPARPTRTRKVQDDDDSDDDFVLRRDEEVQEKQQEKRRRVSLPARSRKSAVSAVSASAGTSTRPRGALKKSADVAAPVVGATNKRKAAQTGESQAAPKKRRVNNEASSTHTGSSTSRTQRRRSAPADDGFSDGGEEYDDGKKSKPARGRRQPGGVWGNADTMFTNGRGGFMKRSEVAALPNTKYRPGGSFGGGKWLEEDTGVLWLPVNPSEQCRKNLVENATPPEPALGAREKTVKKDTKLTTQAVKKTIRLVSQVAAPSSSQISSSQATNSSATIGHSSPAKAPEPESFEEFLSSRGFYTREKFETDSLFWAYISALGPPFSTHPGAPTLGPPPKGKSLDNYIPAETRAHHEAYLAAQEAAGDETHQQQDTESEEQGGQTAQETSQEGVHKTTRTTTKESPEESIGEAAKDIQQTPQVREAEKTDLPDLLRNQGLDLDKPPALDTTEKLARYSTRLRSAVFGLLPRSRGSSSGSRSASPATETPGKKLTTKDAEVKEGAAKEAASKNTAEEADTEDAATEDQNPVNPGTSAGVMTIRTLRPRKGKEVDRGNTLAEPLEKKVCGK